MNTLPKNARIFVDDNDPNSYYCELSDGSMIPVRRIDRYAKFEDLVTFIQNRK